MFVIIFLQCLKRTAQHIVVKVYLRVCKRIRNLCYFSFPVILTKPLSFSIFPGAITAKMNLWFSHSSLTLMEIIIVHLIFIQHDEIVFCPMAD